MVETYSSEQERFYYVTETAYGETPANPAMLSVPAETIEPQIDPGNIKLRGMGYTDLQAIKKGLRKVGCKVNYCVPSAAPIELLQWAKIDENKSLSVQVIYWKGLFASATDIISLLFEGMKIDKASVECEVEDVIRASLELQGKDVTVGTAKITGATYTDHTGAVAFNETYVKKDTVGLDRVSAWKFNVENNLKRVPVITDTDGHLPRWVFFRFRNLSGELTFEFEDKEEADEVLADTEFDLEFGLGSTKKATITDCKWDSITVPSRIEDLIYLKAAFSAKGPLAIA
jgi:hypothetical protein